MVGFTLLVEKIKAVIEIVRPYVAKLLLLRSRTPEKCYVKINKSLFDLRKIAETGHARGEAMSKKIKKDMAECERIVFDADNLLGVFTRVNSEMKRKRPR